MITVYSNFKQSVESALTPSYFNPPLSDIKRQNLARTLAFIVQEYHFLSPSTYQTEIKSLQNRVSELSPNQSEITWKLFQVEYELFHAKEIREPTKYDWGPWMGSMDRSYSRAKQCHSQGLPCAQGAVNQRFLPDWHKNS